MRADDVVLGEAAAVRMKQQHADATAVPIEPFANQTFTTRGGVGLQSKLGAERIGAREHGRIEAKPPNLVTECPTECLSHGQTVV